MSSMHTNVFLKTQCIMEVLKAFCYFFSSLFFISFYFINNHLVMKYLILLTSLKILGCGPYSGLRSFCFLTNLAFNSNTLVYLFLVAFITSFHPCVLVWCRLPCMCWCIAAWYATTDSLYLWGVYCFWRWDFQMLWRKYGSNCGSRKLRGYF